ncbi:Anti-sigma regulatory factor (Ser/Thr protein kinase) [Actinacidiphila yanglinensis]|uniref:Anti-sigma regulatory factor (Ser/Thr protein kinase) n=1 Tax=Actinacidiphila yanglinensis TaxID=310779 RepID=A0A1H6D9P2_9ACTN|nr:ATP-binding protein [Actinacidiphila yanglinensis]SEG82091.1 Anti-sigma regulatory factor (Ser/Thr protein kinase) [Actinacidiphila yanglinensis]
MNDGRAIERDRSVARPPDLWAGAAYDGDTGSIAVARAMTAAFLDRARDVHGLPVPPRAHADAQLVVSELVTNAVKYAPGPCVLNLEIRGPVLEITTWDTDANLPLARAAEPFRIGQHGLEIVFALCDGFEVRREPVGKRITARLALGPLGPFDV